MFRGLSFSGASKYTSITNRLAAKTIRGFVCDAQFIANTIRAAHIRALFWMTTTCFACAKLPRFLLYALCSSLDVGDRLAGVDYIVFIASARGDKTRDAGECVDFVCVFFFAPKKTQQFK